MNDEYRYSNLVRSAEYRFTPEGVEVTTRRFGSMTRSVVSFEKIPIHSSTVTLSSKPLLWATVVLGMCFLVALGDQFVSASPERLAPILYGVLFALAAIAFFLTRITSEVFLFEDEHLSIFRPAGAEGEWKSFINSIQQHKLEVLRQRVARRLAEASGDDIGRYLIYLREADLIDDSGFAELRSHVDKLRAEHRNARLN